MQTHGAAIAVIEALDKRPMLLKLLLKTEICDESNSPE
jgi:hypothetical protein